MYSTPSGEQRKDAAFSTLESVRSSLLRQARRAMVAALLEHGTATIDDVRAVVELPPGVNPKVFGPVATELVAAGITEADGFTRSMRPESHARHVQRWRLVDRPAALRWLASHPEPVALPAPVATFSQPTLFAMQWGHV